MNCALCTSTTNVIDSRVLTETPVIRRRRECAQCGYRFTTYERESGEDPFEELMLLRERVKRMQEAASRLCSELAQETGQGNGVNTCPIVHE